MIEAVFRDFLLTVPALVTLVGTRCYQNRAPQNATYPLLVIRKQDADGTHDLAYLAGHAETRYRVLAASRSFDELIALREGLKTLDGFALAYAVANGIGVGFNVPGTEIQSSIIVYERDDFEESSQLWTLVLDFELMHTETFVPLPAGP